VAGERVREQGRRALVGRRVLKHEEEVGRLGMSAALLKQGSDLDHRTDGDSPLGESAAQSIGDLPCPLLRHPIRGRSSF